MCFVMISWSQNVEINPKLCYMDTGSLIVKDVAKDPATRFNTSNYELES